MSEMVMLSLSVNGQDYSVPEVSGEMLSDLLRERLHLTGTKIGCNESECGACTVLVDGQPVLSCSYPAAKAQGRKVVTIEGLANRMTPGKAASSPSVQPVDGPKLHPLQDAFIQYGAVQCGFCIPGQIMTSYALLLRNPDPSEEDIRQALKDTLCRCAGYPSIIGAIQAAGKSIRTGKPVEPPLIAASSRAGRVVGTVQPRPDAAEKVTGQAIYTDDLCFENMLHARVKRAMIPAGILRRLDISKARRCRALPRF